jgi:hypothetical protein
LKALKLLIAVIAVAFAAGIAQADGMADPRTNLGTGPGGSPTCGSNLENVSSTGLLAIDCLVVSVSKGGTGTITEFVFGVQDTSTFSAGITCSSVAASGQFPLVGWTITSTNVSGGIDTCLAMAPTTVSANTIAILKAMHDPYKATNDGDCDSDDNVLGIQVGCDLKISSLTSQDLFVPNAPVGIGADGDKLPSLPEPGTVSLLVLGLTGLPFLRRKFSI